MRKLFEKPLFHYTFVLTVVSICCGLVIGGVNAITAPIIESNIEKAENRAYQAVLPEGVTFDKQDLTGNPSSISSIVIGKDASEEIVGYIYVAYATNKFGYMRIVLGVDASGEIIGADFIELNQTYGLEGTRTNLSLYIGTQLSALTPEGDIVTGATGSLDTVNALLADMAVAHANTAQEPMDPYDVWYGAGHLIQDDIDFTPSANILNREIVTLEDSEIGYIYTLTASGVYYEDSEASITIYMAFNSNDEVVGVLVPSEEYLHTKGIRYDKIVNYLNSFVGLTVAEFATSLTDDGDLTSGVTNSKVVVDIMLNALIDEVN
jgi:hypothetical protein